MRFWQKFLAVLVLAMAGVAGVLGVNGDASALNTQDILKKWTFVGFRTCAQSNINSPLSTEQSGSVADAVMKAEGTVNLPSYGFGGVSGTSMNCKENFLGSGGMTGVVNYGGISGSTQWSDATGTKNILEGKLKYKFEGKGEKYFTLTATRTSESTVVDGFGERTYPGATVTTQSGRITQNGDTYRLERSDMESIRLRISGSDLIIDRAGLPPGCNWTKPSNFSPVSISFAGKSIEQFANDIVSRMNGQNWTYACEAGTGSGMNYATSTYSFTNEVVDAGQKGEYKWQNKADDAIKEMSGVEVGDLMLDKNQQYVLYKHYVERAAATEGGSINCEEEQTGANWTTLEKWRTGGEFKKCWVSFNGRSPGDISVFTIGSGPKIQRITLQTVINWLNNVNTDELTDVDMVTNGDATDSGGSADVTCASSGAAGSLGWIVCPIMDWLGGAAQDLYNGVVKDSLQVEPELFTGGGGGTRQGWETFRNIANVVFIILFMVVIFSQLTGVGIDNYGIKKILPKLIISAILINLSYWICIVFVDLSNILGNSFQALFNGLAAGLNPSSTVVGADAFGSAGATIVSVIIIGIIVAGAGVAIALNPAILLAMVVGAIGVVISVLFLFVLLSVREAAIVVLVVISPLAVVCYMLPNTKSTFDKWLKFFERLLLVYPICGLLIGGGNYVSRLLLASGVGDGGIFSAVTAMIIGIVPIFFIPTVLRSSFSVMGTIGTRLAGLGREASGRATRRMRESNAYRNAQERGLERQTRIRAGVDRNGNAVGGVRGGVARVLGGGRRGMARNRAQYLKNQETRAREDSLMGTGFESAVAGVEAKSNAQMVSDYEALINNGKVAGVNSNDVGSMGNYHRAALASYAAAQANGDAAGMSAAMAQIKAAQNILSKSDGGRSMVQNNLESAVRNGQTAGLSDAAAHLMSEYGDKYKSSNRGTHAMMSDLATSNLADANTLAGIQSKLDQVDANGNVTSSGAYSMAGTDKYTAESLAGADDQAIQRLVDSVNNGSMQGQELHDIQATAYEALEKQNSGNLNIKPEVAKQLEQLAANYTPVPASNDRANMISHGAYEDPAGNVYHLREMDNGKYLDDSGFEVDITHFKKR